MLDAGRIQQLWVILAALATSGCSLLAPRTQTLLIRVSEPNAKVYINGRLIGSGTTSLKADRGDKAEITVIKEGYYPMTKTLDRGLSVLGRLDAVGGYIILLPLLGLVSPGAYQFNTTEVDFQLKQIQTRDDEVAEGEGNGEPTRKAP